MPITVVRLGSPRTGGEGPRLGTVRRPPRGVKKMDYASRDFFDVWLPDLAPSPALLAWALSERWTPARWTSFARKYRREMREPGPGRLLALLAALSRSSSFAVGCYCEDASHCHRTVLAELLSAAGADVKLRLEPSDRSRETSDRGPRIADRGNRRKR
jgi:uncharacterized protein YeaO (DUF488 family)